MIRLIISELKRQFKKTSFKLLILIILISSFLTCYISYKKVDNEYIKYSLIDTNGLNKRELKLTNKYNEYVSNQNMVNNISNIKLNKIMNNGVTLLIFSSIIMIIISSSMLGNEINKKSIKELLTKPYRRSKILISKYLATYIITFLLTIFIFITYILFVYFLTKNNYIVRIQTIFKYLSIFIVNSIPIYFLSTLTIFLTTFIKNQKIIIPMNTILFIMSPAIFNFFLNIKFKYIIYTFIPYLDFSIFKDFYSIYLLNIEYNMNFSRILGIIVLLLYSLVFIIISIKIFNRKDFY